MTARVIALCMAVLTLFLGSCGGQTVSYLKEGDSVNATEQLVNALNCTSEQAEKINSLLSECGIKSIDSITVKRNENGYIFATVSSAGASYSVDMTKKFRVEEIVKKGPPKDELLYQINY